MTSVEERSQERLLNTSWTALCGQALGNSAMAGTPTPGLFAKRRNHEPRGAQAQLAPPQVVADIYVPEAHAVN
jgi:hypothetical protein